LFSGPFLERRAELRDDPGWIAAARSDPNTRYVVAEGARQLVSRGHAARRRTAAQRRPAVVRPRTHLHLVRWFRGERTVLVEFGQDSLAQEAGLPEATELKELRPLAPMLPADAASLLAYAARAGVVARAGTGIAASAARRTAGARRPRHALQPLRERDLSAPRSRHHRAGHRMRAASAPC
jgi:hypothetical protein